MKTERAVIQRKYVFYILNNIPLHKFSRPLSVLLNGERKKWVFSAIVDNLNIIICYQSSWPRSQLHKRVACPL